jgi:transcriptional regulator with XRE-family HTH domain
MYYTLSKPMDIYSLNDYKEIVRFVTNDRRKQYGGRFTFEKLAQACGVQKTYLSKVLNGSGQLNADQLYSACEFLKISETETEYILLIRDWELATHLVRKKNLWHKINKLRAKYLKTEASVEANLSPAIESYHWEYYTDIDLQLVHLFLTIPHYASEPLDICAKIGISKEQLHTILLKLQNWQIVSFKNEKYSTNDVKLHLSEDAKVYPAYRVLNRLRTIERVRQNNSNIVDNNNSDYFFS